QGFEVGYGDRSSVLPGGNSLDPVAHIAGIAIAQHSRERTETGGEPVVVLDARILAAYQQQMAFQKQTGQFRLVLRRAWPGDVEIEKLDAEHVGQRPSAHSDLSHSSVASLPSA